MTDSVRATTDTAESSHPIVNKLLGAFLAVAVVGLGTSLLLTAVHFLVLPLPDGVSPAGGLIVLSSTWAYVGPLPLALFGVGYYLTMVVLGGLWLETKDDRLELPILGLTGAGLAASAYFVYLQLIPIGAVCPFCMLSAAATATLFGIELVVKYFGGGSVAPPVDGTRIWPPLLVATVALAVLSMYAIGIAPFPEA